MRYVTILIIVALVAGCGKKQPVSFKEQIQPVLNARCTQCHGKDIARGKIVMTSYASFMNSHTIPISACRRIHPPPRRLSPPLNLSSSVTGLRRVRRTIDRTRRGLTINEALTEEQKAFRSMRSEGPGPLMTPPEDPGSMMRYFPVYSSSVSHSSRPGYFAHTETVPG